MKIVCDSCGAKYSIADEKVAGKIFKIRCKKCSSVLEVRGDQTGAHALEGAGQAQEPAADNGWYIVVDGEQRGPLPPIELSQLFAKGSVGLDSYVWKEGFDDWKVASDVPELVQLLGGVSSARKNETAKIETDSAAPFGTGGDLFGDNGREPTGETDTDEGVFGGLGDDPAPAQQSPFAAEPSADAPAEEPEPAGAGLGGLGVAGVGAEPARMTGQRNENSVLFSLSNLQQLASRGGSPAESAQGSAPVQQASPSPQAAGEGSGLIDIRALAKSTTPGTQKAPSQAVDDLLAIGTTAGGPVLGGPLLGPAPAETTDNNRWIKIAGLGLAFVAVIGLGFGFGMFMKSSSDEPLEIAAPETTPDPAIAAAAPVAEPEQAPEPAAAAEEPVAAAFEEPAEEPLEAPDFDEPAQATARPARRERASSRPKRRRTKAAAPAAAPEPAPAPKKRSGNLDALMDEVVGGSSSPQKKQASAKPSGGGSSLADSPSRADVKTALQGVSGGVKACSQGQGGTAVVDVTFSGSTGRVSRAKVGSGPFKGTPTGSCIEKAVKRARVPRFKQSSFKVKFPYRL
ncbi:MAG: GYF domain-containing protein [Myxococcota bacterium]